MSRALHSEPGRRALLRAARLFDPGLMAALAVRLAAAQVLAR